MISKGRNQRKKQRDEQRNDAKLETTFIAPKTSSDTEQNQH